MTELLSYEGDVETLEAVVAFIDDYYEADDALLSGDPSAVSSDAVVPSSSSSEGDHHSHQTTTTPKFPNSNRARNLRRKEIALLRQEAEQLQTRLLKLVMGRTTGEFGHNPRPTAVRHEMVAMWKAIALRQCSRRRASEAENTRLREHVRAQRKLLQRLRAPLMCHENLQPSFRLGSSSWNDVLPSGGSNNRVRVFVELLADLKQVHSSTDAWLSSSRCAPLTDGKYDDARVASVSPTNHSLELVFLRLLPLDFRTASDIYWRVGINELCKRFDLFREVTTIEGRDTVLYSQILHDSNESAVQLRTHVSIQKIEEENRIIIVMAARPEVIRIGEARIADIKMAEKYWIVLQAPEGKPHDACRMFLFGHTTIEIATAKTSDPRTVSTLTAHVSNRISGHLNASVEAIEDTVLGTVR
ncbi:hypothetical protein Poli38472_007545 [Pythium oligandrum]|uniref:Uncharacterized protein n=1 Tax=Pythium oligandrum TaxID=41045 RepID=A0A8K1FRS6_PYTOL|nr:hypothetical protein Poli38472_007545 [Pythium oligandrum]|eukprot:TMW67873.1 hypothetical protein Poli38472_007545 [Pythium oligandrum]